MLIGLGGDDVSDRTSFVELSGEATKCPKMSKFPVKVMNAAGAVFLGHPVICGGLIARAVA